MNGLIILAFLAIPAAVLAFMLLRKRRAAAARATSTCGETCHPGGTVDPSAWYLGPDLKGFDQDNPGRIVGHPAVYPGGGFVIELPQAWPLGHLHYATFCHGPLEGRKLIRIRGRVEMDGGVELITDVPGIPGHLTPYFQRRGDNWSAGGEFETYRWWASFAALKLVPGAFEIVAPLDGNWTATLNSSRDSNPEGFAAALRDAGCVGFTTGGGTGYGHGMSATGPARLIIDEFTVE